MRWLEPKLGDESAASWVVDRGKRSIGVDLKSPRGVEVVRRLARSADAFVESFRPGVADRLGVGYEALRAEHPGLVYCSISGYGQDWPAAARGGPRPELHRPCRPPLDHGPPRRPAGDPRRPGRRPRRRGAARDGRPAGSSPARRAHRRGRARRRLDDRRRLRAPLGAPRRLLRHGRRARAGADAPERRLPELQRLRLRRREAPHRRRARGEVLRGRVRGRGAAGARRRRRSTPRRCPSGASSS